MAVGLLLWCEHCVGRWGVGGMLVRAHAGTGRACRPWTGAAATRTPGRSSESDRNRSDALSRGGGLTSAVASPPICLSQPVFHSLIPPFPASASTSRAPRPTPTNHHLLWPVGATRSHHRARVSDSRSMLQTSTAAAPPHCPVVGGDRRRRPLSLRRCRALPRALAACATAGADCTSSGDLMRSRPARTSQSAPDRAGDAELREQVEGGRECREGGRDTRQRDREKERQSEEKGEARQLLPYGRRAMSTNRGGGRYNVRRQTHDEALSI
jgi:hypothetical protein